MQVWVTRSQPGADRHARALEAAGFDPLTLPVLDIEPLSAEVPAGPFDVVIFLSEHAVRHPGTLAFCDGARVLAVGPATAAVLSSEGIAVDSGTVVGTAADRAEAPDREAARISGAAGQGSEGLLESELLRRISGLSVLIVSGEGGRRLLASELKQRGATVTQLQCYRRRFLDPELPDPREIDAILVGSGDGFESVARVWFAQQGRAEVPVLVPSARVAGLGPTLGFSRVIDCGSAGVDACIAELRKLS